MGIRGDTIRVWEHAPVQPLVLGSLIRNIGQSAGEKALVIKHPFPPQKTFREASCQSARCLRISKCAGEASRHAAQRSLGPRCAAVRLVTGLRRAAVVHGALVAP